MNNTAKIITAFAGGAAAGAILGILFAPDKGSDTRKKISERGKKISGDLKNKLGKDKINGFKPKVDEARNDKVKEFEEMEDLKYSIE